MTLQVIEKNGKPEYAIVPYADYVHLVEQVEMLQDVHDYDQIKKTVENGTEEVFPAELVDALLAGANPVKTWREFRQITQQQVADAIGVSTPYLSQIESGKRKPSTDVLKKLTNVLGVTVDDLI